MSRREAVVVARDLLTRTKLEDAARAAGFEPTAASSLPPPPDEPPALLLVDAPSTRALDGVGAWVTRWPDLRVVAVVSHVDTQTRDAAARLGYRAVTRGSLVRQGARILQRM